MGPHLQVTRPAETRPCGRVRSWPALVAEYVGQTAVRTHAMIDSALPTASCLLMRRIRSRDAARKISAAKQSRRCSNGWKMTGTGSSSSVAGYTGPMEEIYRLQSGAGIAFHKLPAISRLLAGGTGRKSSIACRHKAGWFARPKPTPPCWRYAGNSTPAAMINSATPAKCATCSRPPSAIKAPAWSAAANATMRRADHFAARRLARRFWKRPARAAGEQAHHLANCAEARVKLIATRRHGRCVGLNGLFTLRVKR